jgi:hypothetical protein
MITKIKVSPLRLEKNGKIFIYTFLELSPSSPTFVGFFVCGMKGRFGNELD